VFISFHPLCERAFRSRLTLREECQVELSGRRLTDLAPPNAACLRPKVSTLFLADRLPVESLNLFSQKLNTNRPLQFQKRSQLFFRSYNETLPIVAMCVSNPEATLRLARDDGLVDPICADAKEQDAIGGNGRGDTDRRAADEFRRFGDHSVGCD
jgi:hypothetical protein